MELTKRIIKAMAIKDMYSWIGNFENDGSINEYTEDIQNIYWEYIRKIQNRILKEI